MKTIGVIGLGSIGSRHYKNLKLMGYEPIGFDSNKMGGYTLERLLKEANAIVIASPTDLHFEQFRRARFDYGKPVFVEKPIFHKRDIDGRHVTMVGYNLRFHSCVKKAKEWLDAGLIGKPLWANFTLGQFNDRPHYLRDGVILNWSHEIDLCLYLLGNADVAASSTRLTDGKDDMTDILLTHKSGCRSTVHLDYLTKPEVRSFHIGGDKGAIGASLVDRATSRWMTDSEIATEAFIGEDTWNDNYIEEMQAFIERIDGKETIGCTGEEGLEVLKICLEVRKQAGLA